MRQANRPVRALVVTFAGAVCLGLAALVGLCLAGLHVWRSGYGLDRTDEGQYLLLMAHPGDDPATVFLSGYVLHPLYVLLGGDVGALRPAGFAVTAALAGWLLGRVARAGGARRWEAICAVVAGGGAAAVAFAWFPLTPSYNTIALWGCLLVGIALLRLVPLTSLGSRASGRRSGGRACALVGVGVAVTALGKPTSGLAAALVVLCALLVLTPWRRLTSTLLAVALGGAGTAAAFCLAVFVTTRRTPGDLLETMLEGVRSVRLLGGHEQLVRWDPLAPATWPAAFGQVVAGSPWTPTTLQVALLLPLAAALALALRRPDRRVVAVGVALIALPACYAFGTNTNLWSGMGRAAPLWLAALALAAGARRPLRPRELADPGLASDAHREHPEHPEHREHPQNPERDAAQDGPEPIDREHAVTGRAAGPWAARAGAPLVVAVALLGGVASAAAQASYRYPPPDADTVSGVVDTAGHELRLTPQDARDSSAIVAAAAAVAGRDVLDTTGASPGYIWQLGGRALGSSWLLGGYPGSDAAARHALSLVPCERIQRALVLYAPESPRRLDDVAIRLGADPTFEPNVDSNGDAEPVYRRILTFRHQLGYEVQLLEPTGARAPRCPTP